MRALRPTLPIVAISGVLLNSTGRTALDFFEMAPAFANIICLQKPFRPERLFQAVRNAIEFAPLQPAS